MHSQQHPVSHHLRHYIVLATVIIGGLFLLFLFSDDIENTILNSAIISGTEDLVDEVKEESTTTTKKGSSEVEMSLTFNEVPHVTEETEIEEMQITSEDFSTNIKVNDNKLELGNLETINLGLEDFEGNIDFDSTALTLSGTAKRIEVNGLAFSSDKGIEISFDGLDYQSLSFPLIELNKIKFVEGDGQLEVADKLQYNLEDEDLQVTDFTGSLNINEENNSIITMDGTAGKILASGNILNFRID